VGAGAQRGVTTAAVVVAAVRVQRDRWAAIQVAQKCERIVAARYIQLMDQLFERRAGLSELARHQHLPIVAGGHQLIDLLPRPGVA